MSISDPSKLLPFPSLFSTEQWQIIKETTSSLTTAGYSIYRFSTYRNEALVFFTMGVATSVFRGQLGVSNDALDMAARSPFDCIAKKTRYPMTLITGLELAVGALIPQAAITFGLRAGVVVGDALTGRNIIRIEKN